VPGDPAAAEGEKLVAPAVGFNRAGLVEIFAVIKEKGVLHHLQATASGQAVGDTETFPQP
jgi:hypothetical protein